MMISYYTIKAPIGGNNATIRGLNMELSLHSSSDIPFNAFDQLVFCFNAPSMIYRVTIVFNSLLQHVDISTTLKYMKQNSLNKWLSI